MARPKKDGLYYFPHDVTMSSDSKIETLEAKFDLAGYAVYVKMLERIYKESDFELDVSNEVSFAVLAKHIGIKEKKLKEIIDYCAEINLFDNDKYVNQKILTSNGISKRAEIVTAKRVKMQSAYKKEKENIIVSDAETQQKSSRNDAETQQKVHKEKKSKENKRKEKEDSLDWGEIRKNPADFAGSSEYNYSEIYKLVCDEFCKAYRESRKEEYLIEESEYPKEMGAIKKMVLKLQEMSLGMSDSELIEYMSEFFRKAMKSEHGLLKNNISPSMVLNQTPLINSENFGRNGN